MSDSLRPHGLYPARLLCPWDSPGNNTGVGCHALLLQGISPSQGSNPGLPIAGGFFIRWATRDASLSLSLHVIICIGFPSGSAVKNPPARQETRETKFQSPGQEDPLKEEMSTSVFLPGKFHGQRSLAGWSPWGLKESDVTEHACMPAYNYSLRCFLCKWDCALYCILFWIVLLFSYMSFHIGTLRTTSHHGTEILWFKIIPFLYRFPEVVGRGQRICTFKILIGTNQLAFNNLHQFIVHKSDCFSDFFSYQHLILLIFLTYANLMGKNTILYFLASLWSWASLLHLLVKHEYVFNNKLFVYSLCPFFFKKTVFTPFFTSLVAQ